MVLAIRCYAASHARWPSVQRENGVVLDHTLLLEKAQTLIKGPAFPERIICIDYDSVSIQAVEVDFAGKVYNLASMEVPGSGSVCAALADLIEGFGFGCYPIFIAYSSTGQVNKTASVPSVLDQEITTALSFGALKKVSIPREKLAYDFMVLSRSASESEVLVSAENKDSLQQIVDIVTEAGQSSRGLRPVSGMMPGMAGLIEYHKGLKGVQAILNIGYKVVTILIFQDEKLLFNRDIVFGIVDLFAKTIYREDVVQDYVARAKKITAAVGLETIQRLDDEKVKAGSKHMKMSAEEQEAFEEARESGMARLMQNVRLSIGYFKTQTKVEQLDCLNITGYGSALPGMRLRLHDEFHTLVKVIDPFEEYEMGTDDQGLHLRLERDRYEYGRVMGMARYLKEEKYQAFNWLVPRDERKMGLVERVKRDPILALGPAAILLALILIVMHISGNMRINSMEREQKNITARVAELSPLQEELQELQEFMDASERQAKYLSSLHAGRSWSQIFLRMSEIMPEGVGIDQFRFGHGSHESGFEISGTTLNTPRVTETARVLQSSRFFRDVQIVAANQEAEQVRFQLRGRLAE